MTDLAAFTIAVAFVAVVVAWWVYVVESDKRR